MKIHFESRTLASRSWKASVGLLLTVLVVQALSSASVPLPATPSQSAGADAHRIARFVPLEEGTTLYRLGAASSLEEGCQAPCACPLLITDDVFGTFALTFHATDGKGQDHYRMHDVNWVLGTL